MMAQKANFFLFILLYIGLLYSLLFSIFCDAATSVQIVNPAIITKTFSFLQVHNIISLAEIFLLYLFMMLVLLSLIETMFFNKKGETPPVKEKPKTGKESPEPKGASVDDKQAPVAEVDSPTPKPKLDPSSPEGDSILLDPEAEPKSFVEVLIDKLKDLARWLGGKVRELSELPYREKFIAVIKTFVQYCLPYFLTFISFVSWLAFFLIIGYFFYRTDLEVWRTLFGLHGVKISINYFKLYFGLFSTFLILVVLYFED